MSLAVAVFLARTLTMAKLILVSQNSCNFARMYTPRRHEAQAWCAKFLRVIPRSCMLHHKKIDKNTAHNSLFLHACCNIEIKKYDRSIYMRARDHAENIA